jgi:hypothetical protein
MTTNIRAMLQETHAPTGQVLLWVVDMNKQIIKSTFTANKQLIILTSH